MSDILTNEYDQTRQLKLRKEIAKNAIEIEQFCYQYDGRNFSFGNSTALSLPAGFYSIAMTQTQGIILIPENVKPMNILNAQGSISNSIVKEVEDFWEREEIYKRYKTPHKRGILMYGPPGSGKSSCIKILIENVIKRGGIVINVPTNFEIFVAAIDEIRKRDPEIPIVAIMEDFENFATHQSSIVLNTLDGVKPIHKIVFIATTNHPEKLGPRFMNRPKRFDTVIEIGFPEAALRAEYLKYIITSKGEFKFEDCIKDFDISMEKWIEDTDGLSFAHMDELFTNVVLLGANYDDILNKIKVMSEKHPGYAFNGKKISDDNNEPCDDDIEDDIEDD